ncbi:MAG: hypothetical protein ACI30S_02740 [Muribaculaceae bacterium]
MSNEGNSLNSWFNAILWLNIILSGIGLILNVIGVISENIVDLYIIVSFISVSLAVFGLYRMLREDRKGFYCFVAGCLINAIIGYIQYANISADDYGLAYNMARSASFKVVWVSLGKIVFIMLLMLLRSNGRNVYQVLWNKGRCEIESVVVPTEKKKGFDNGLNEWLSVFLLIWAFFGVCQIGVYAWDCINGENVIYSVIVLFLAALRAFGFAYMFMARRIGFYVAMASLVIEGLFSIVSTGMEDALGIEVLSGILKPGLLLLLMLLRYKGKNAYQVLWKKGE